MEYDIIIIGSGLGGLACASRLSALGYKVLVLEKHFLPGGYATNFKRKGYEFDVSLHGIGGLSKEGNVHNILNACGALKYIVPLKNKAAYSILWNDKYIEIPNNCDEYKKLLKSIFKNYEKEIDNFFNAIKRFSIGFSHFVLNKNKFIFSKLHKDVFIFMKWSEKTTDEVIRNYIDDDEFVRFFTAIWPYYGMPPKKLSSLYFFIPWISYHLNGKYYIKGGAQSLSNAFVKAIRENNGEVILKSKVSSINYLDGKVSGVILENEDQIKSRWVVYNGSPLNLLDILPKGTLKEKEELKIKNFKIGCSLTQLYIALDCNPNDLNIPDDEVFYMGGKSPEEDYEISLNNDYKNAGFLLTNYNSMDDTLNPSDKGVITITFIDSYNYWNIDRNSYNERKDKVSNIIIARLEKLFKNIKEHIVLYELGTPRTMEKYTLNPKGAVYGYSQEVKQAGRYRLKNKTSIKNLNIVGAWVSPGGGYEGVISSGITCAELIRKKLKKL